MPRPADSFRENSISIILRIPALWGVYDRTTSGAVRLETSSRDLCGFRFWHPLPAAYRYARLATRSELRDYTAALAFYECRAHVRK